MENFTEEQWIDNIAVFENSDFGFSGSLDDDGFPIANYFNIEILFWSAIEANKFKNLLIARFDEEIKNCEVNDLIERDWVDLYVKELCPVTCGDFYIFNDSLCNYTENYDLIPIKLNSSLAFGSGHHQTTRACILNLVKLAELGEFRERSAILDMGCGTGILGVCAAKILNHSRLLGVDIDCQATEIAEHNYLANEVDGTVLASAVVPVGDVSDVSAQKFGLILCNILKQPLIDMCGDFWNALERDGNVIISGFILNQEDEIMKHYESIGFIQKNRICIDEWVSILLCKQ
jgi:ribosomal protein L11 methyltransferase